MNNERKEKRSALEIISELCQGAPYIQEDEYKKELLKDIQEKKEELKNVH